MTGEAIPFFPVAELEPSKCLERRQVDLMSLLFFVFGRRNPFLPIINRPSGGWGDEEVRNVEKTRKLGVLQVEDDVERGVVVHDRAKSARDGYEGGDQDNP